MQDYLGPMAHFLYLIYTVELLLGVLRDVFQIPKIHVVWNFVIHLISVSYAQIDWHDFVVVETVDFAINEVGNFPPPTTPEEVGARLLAQERFESNPIKVWTKVSYTLTVANISSLDAGESTLSCILIFHG